MTTTTLRIVSYNIRKTRGLDQRRDPLRTLEVINRLGADVVVLQEADRRMGRRKAALSRDLIEQHSGFHVVPLAENDVSLGWHGNAVLVRSGIDVQEVTRMALPGLEPRGAAAITLSGAFDLTLVATHLGLRRRDRLAQQAAICDQLPAEASVVVAGDFNEWSRRAGFEPFERRFRVHAPGKSFPAGVALAPLDRFAVSPHVEVRGTGVAREGLARRASDHLPVWCEITLGGGA